MKQVVKARLLMMVHRVEDLWTEGPARTLNRQIWELQARVAFSQHWSSGEHEHLVQTLRQLDLRKTAAQQHHPPTAVTHPEVPWSRCHIQDSTHGSAALQYDRSS